MPYRTGDPRLDARLEQGMLRQQQILAAMGGAVNPLLPQWAMQAQRPPSMVIPPQMRQAPAMPNPVPAIQQILGALGSALPQSRPAPNSAMAQQRQVDELGRTMAAAGRGVGAGAQAIAALGPGGGNTTGLGAMLAPQRPDEPRVKSLARGVASIPHAAAALTALGGNPTALSGVMRDAGVPQAFAGMMQGIGQAPAAVAGSLAQTGSWLMERQSDAGKRMKNFMDPGYDILEAQVAQQVGVDPAMLKAIRVHGERSNADQVSSAGAKTVYQVIPSTRNLFLKKYGVDAYAGPGQAAMVAALHLKESMQRGEDPVRGYIGGPDKSNWRGTTESYASRVYGALGPQMDAALSGLGAAPPAFNAAPYEAAMAAQTQAANLLSQPYSQAFEETPLPDRPMPEFQQAPDYTAGDEAFKATQPRNPFDDPKEKVRIQRTQWLNGIGRAMASLGGDEGIGTMLLKMGAGSLMGKARGEEMIDQKEAEFEQNMQEYNRALANREDSKATQLANVMNSNIQTRNQLNEALWQDNIAKIKSKNPQFDAQGNMITFAKDPKNPNGFIRTVTPVARAIQAEALLNRANLNIQMGQAQQSAGQFAYQHQMANSRYLVGMGMKFALAEGNGAAANDGYIIEGARRARATVQTGNWRQLFNDPRYTDQLDQQAREVALRSLPQPPAEGLPMDAATARIFQENYEDALTGLIVNKAKELGQLNRLIATAPGDVAMAAQRSATERTTERRTRTGTAVTTAWDMEE